MKLRCTAEPWLHFMASRQQRCLVLHLSDSWLVKSVTNLVNIFPISPQINYRFQQIPITTKLVSTTTRDTFGVRVLNPNRDKSQEEVETGSWQNGEWEKGGYVERTGFAGGRKENCDPSRVFFPLKVPWVPNFWGSFHILFSLETVTEASG